MFQMLNVFAYTNAFILYFLPVCSVLIYQRYTNANICPWWVGTRQDIFPSNNSGLSSQDHVTLYELQK